MSEFPEVKDHLVANPDKYTMTTNPDGTVTLRPTWVDNPSEVLQEGTPVDAAFLQKIPEAIDAIDTKVTSQLAEKVKKGDLFIDVTDFGAKGDGVTDDTASFANAIQYAVNNGKKIVFVPGKLNHYVIGDLVIPSGITIEGDGSIVKKSTALGVLDVNGDNCTIDGLTISSLNLSSNDGFLIRINGKGNKVTNCKTNMIFGSKEYAGILLGGSSQDTVISKNLLKNCGYMILASDGASDILISKNYFTGGSTKGVVDGSGNFTTTPAGDGVKLSRGLGGQYVKVINNVFNDVYRDCIDAFSMGVHIDFSHNICRNVDVLVADLKTIYRDTGVAGGSTDPNNKTRDISLSFNDIDMTPLASFDSSVMFIGHTDERADSLYTDVQYSVNRIKVFGNKIKTNSKYALRIKKSKYIQVQHNEIRGATLRSINLEDGCHDVDVEDNQIYITPNINVIYGIACLAATSKRVRVKRNKIFGPSHGGSGLNIYGAQVWGEQNEVEGNSVYETTFGISVGNTSDTTVTDNRLYTASTAGIRVGENGLAQRMVVSKNMSKDCGRAIMFLNNPVKVVFVDNTANNCPLTWSNDTTLVTSVNRNNDVITL